MVNKKGSYVYYQVACTDDPEKRYTGTMLVMCSNEKIKSHQNCIDNTRLRSFGFPQEILKSLKINKQTHIQSTQPTEKGMQMLLTIRKRQVIVHAYYTRVLKENCAEQR